MKGGLLGKMIFRVLVAFALSTWLVYTFPGVVRVVLAPLVSRLAEWTCPYVDDLRLSGSGMMMQINGSVTIAMTMQNGEPLPEFPGSWQKHIATTAHLLVVTVAAFFIPPMPIKRRLLALPVTLAVSLLVCSYHLSIEIQETALRVIGQSLLKELPLAQTEANYLYFKGMEAWYAKVLWIKSFNDSGGSLFLAVIAGLCGYVSVSGSRIGPANGRRSELS